MCSECAATIDHISDIDRQSKDATTHNWFNQKKYNIKQIFNYHEDLTGKNTKFAWTLDVKTAAWGGGGIIELK